MDAVSTVNIDSRTRKQVRLGTVISYISLFVEIAVNLLFIPWLSRSIGQANYGLYTMASSTIGIFLFDFGLSGSVTKFLSKYKAEGNKDGEAKFLGIITKMYLVIDAAVFLVAFILYFFLGALKGLTDSELSTFKILYIIVGVYSVLSIPLVTLNGVFSANEDFAALKSFSLLQKIISVVLMSLAVFFNLGLYIVVLCSVSTSLLTSLIKFLYLKIRYKTKVDFKYKNKDFTKSILSFSIWIAILTVAQKITLNFFPTVLGIVSDSSAIAVYGFALTIETYAYSLTSVISDMFLPKLSRMAQNKANKNEFDDLFVKIGKFQLFVIGIVFAGYLVVGKEFSVMLMGENYASSYWCVLLLFIPMIISVPKVTMESQSYVLDTVKYSSFIVISCAVLASGLSFVFGKFWGAIGVCLSSCIFDVLAYTLRDFLVYKKRQHIDIVYFIKNCYLRYIVPVGIVIAFGLLLKHFMPINGWHRFILLVLAMIIVYLVSCYLFFLTKKEKSDFTNNIYTKVASDNFCCSSDKSVTRLFKRIFQSGIFKIHSFSLRKGKNGIPFVFIVISFVALLFSSGYPLDSVRLWSSVIAFAITFYCFVLYCFPFKKWSKGFKGFFSSFASFPMLFVIYIILSMSMTYIYVGDFSHPFGLLRSLIVILSAFMFSQEISFSDFSELFRKSIFYISFLSLSLFLISYISGTSISSLIFSSSSATYNNFLFIYFGSPEGSGRNYGLFWEPGVFSSFILIGMTLEILSKKPKLIRLLIMMAALITTKSLAGFLLLPLVAMIFICKKFNKSWTLVFPVLVLLVVSAFFLSPSFVVSLIGKIFPSILTKGESLTTRFYSFSVDIDMFITSPIFGVGLHYGELFAQIASANYPGYLDSSVSTFGYFLGAFGLLGITLLLSFVISFLLLPTKSFSVNMLLLLLAVLIANKEPHVSSCLSWCLFFFSLEDGFSPAIFGKNGSYSGEYSFVGAVSKPEENFKNVEVFTYEIDI